LDAQEIWNRLRNATKNGELGATTTGPGSAAQYGVLAIDSTMSIRVSDVDRALELLEVVPTRAFPNIELFEVEDETSLFDCRIVNNVIWASPIQTLLELATGSPREKEAAEKLEMKLLGAEASLL
jgi:hypothetical protein